MAWTDNYGYRTREGRYTAPRRNPRSHLPQHPEANQVIGEVADVALSAGRQRRPVPARGPTTADTAKRTCPMRSNQRLTGLEVLGKEIEGGVAAPRSSSTPQCWPWPSPRPSSSRSATGSPSPLKSIARRRSRTHCWPARLEQLATPPRSEGADRQPHWLLDVAHNPAGAWALRAGPAGHGCPTSSSEPLLFSCLRDKPVG